MLYFRKSDCKDDFIYGGDIPCVSKYFAWNVYLFTQRTIKYRVKEQKGKIQMVIQFIIIHIYLLFVLERGRCSTFGYIASTLIKNLIQALNKNNFHKYHKKFKRAKTEL